MSTTVNMVRVMNVDESSDGFWTRAKLEQFSVKMQIETGSKASLVSYKIYRRCMKHFPLRPSDTIFRAYTGHPVHERNDRCTGTVQQSDCETYSLCHQEKLHSHNGTCVAKGNPSQLARGEEVVTSSTQLQVILEKHKEVFRDELGSMKDFTVKLHV